MFVEVNCCFAIGYNDKYTMQTSYFFMGLLMIFIMEKDDNSLVANYCK